MSDIDRIVANLGYLAGNVADAVEKEVLRGCKSIQADAKLLVAVDTGETRNSIVTNVIRDAEFDIVGTVGSSLPNAVFEEFGTGPKGQASAKDLPEGVSITYRQTPWVFKLKDRFITTRGKPARPFLLPAFKNNEAKIKENIQKAIKSAMREK